MASRVCRSLHHGRVDPDPRSAGGRDGLVIRFPVVEDAARHRESRRSDHLADARATCRFIIGGYLAGRLRTKWASLHTHEIYFRDTAHGFIAWAVALVISTLLFVSYATSIAARPTARQRRTRWQLFRRYAVSQRPSRRGQN